MRFCRSCRRLYRDDHHEFCSADGQPLALVDEANDPLVGVEIDGRYRLTERLGSGGHGVVYLAEQLELDRTVAVKMLYAERMKERQAVRRFAREARVLASLDHPGCVRVLDYATGDGVPYLVMERVTGRPLAQLIRPEGMPPQHAVHVVAQIMDAVDAAHRAGIVHRDLKPENAILDVRDGELRVRIIDFGLAIVAPEDGGSETRLTRDGTVIGTPEYMAPEQILGREADGRTDLYALGVVLFELLRGVPPFTADDAPDTLLGHLHEPPPRLGLFELSDRETAEELADLVDGLLEKRPADRPSTASAVAARLRKIEARLPDAGPTALVLRRGSSEPPPVDGDTTEDFMSVPPGPMDLDPFVGLAADEKTDHLLQDALSAQRRSRNVRVVVGVLSLLVLGALAFPLVRPWLTEPSQIAPSSEPTVPPVASEAVDVAPTRSDGDEDGPARVLPTRGTVDVPGGEPQRSYEASLRALQSQLSRQGLRPRDVRAHPGVARAWSAQSAAAGEGRYAEAVTSLAEISALAGSMSPRQWMVYRLQRAERRLGDDAPPAEAARVRALWQLLDRTSERAADVRSFMSRIDGLEDR